MAEPISIQQLKDASEDAITLADFIYKPANVMIPRRLAADINSLQYYLNYMSSYAQRSYETYDEMIANAANLPNGVSAFVTNDLDISKNGMYTYNGISFVKGDYQPENAAKDFVEAKLGGLQVFDGKILSKDVVIEPIQTGATSITQLDKNRENVSIMDFFTQEELSAHASQGLLFDASRPVQAFFDYIAANDVGIANASGKFGTSKSILFAPVSASKTTMIEGYFKLQPLYNNFVGKMLFHFSPGRVNWFGTIDLETLFYTYVNRQTDYGLQLGGGERGGSYCFIDTVKAGGHREFGIYAGQVSSGTTIRSVEVHGNGSGHFDTRFSYPKTTISNRVDSEGATGQYTELTVSVLPPEGLKFLELLVGDTHNRDVYTVTNVDRVNNKIRIYPILDRTITTASVMYLYGAGLFLLGGDASVLNFDSIQASANSYGARFSCLYPPIVGSLVAQANCVSLGLGMTLSSASLGGSIDHMYTEANEIDFVRATTAPISFTFASDVTFDLNKVRILGDYRLTGSNNKSSNVGLKGLSGTYDGHRFSYASDPFVANYFDITSVNTSILSRRVSGDTPATVYINEPNKNRIKLLGLNTRKLVFLSNNTADLSSNAVITFVAPSGWLFQNNSDNYIHKGFEGLIEFTMLADANTNIIYIGSDKGNKKQLTGYSYNPVALAAGVQQSTTHTLTGVSVGDTVVASVDTPLQGTQIWAEVTAANTVVVYHRNGTEVSVDIPACVLKLKVI